MIDLNECGIKKEVKQEVERFTLFQNSLLGKESDITFSKINTKKYVKYILKVGKIEEKRNLLLSIKQQIILKNKILELF